VRWPEAKALRRHRAFIAAGSTTTDSVIAIKR
jgi:hypothetical protein